MGRLLITLILCHENLLKEPVLYLSLYFKTWREQYYDLLQRVRNQGGWELWLDFFMTAVEDTAHEAVRTSRRLATQAAEDRKIILSLGRAADSALKVHDAMLRSPVITIGRIVETTGIWHNTARATLRKLEGLGMVRKLTGGRRNMVFCYDGYLNILNEGTEPIS